MPMLRQEYVRQYRQGTQQGQENTVLLLLQKYSYADRAWVQFPSEYRADGNQQICGEGYLRYGQ